MKDRIMIRLGISFFCASCSLASATLISVDFSTATSALASGDTQISGLGVPHNTNGLVLAGQVGAWNRIVVSGNSVITNGTLTASNLINGNGQVTSVGFVFNTTASNWVSFNNTSGALTNDALRRDYIFLRGSTPGSVAWEINGLTPGNSYDLILFGGADNQRAAFTINGSAVTLDTEEDGNVQGAVADGTGRIVGTLGRTADAFNDWSGFQIADAIPEPASVTLLGLGILALAAARRNTTRGPI